MFLILVIPALLLLVHGQNILGQGGPSQLCTSAPFNLPTNCNLTCDHCGNTRDICTQCQDNMVLSDEECIAAPHKKIFYSEFFMEPFISDDDTGMQKFSTNYEKITKDEYVTKICMAGISKWEIIGMFSTQQVLIYKHTFPLPLQAISINLRLFTIRDLNSLEIRVNKKKAYESQFNTGVVRTNELTEQRQYLIEEDHSDSIDTMMIPIRTDFLPAHNVLTIQIQISMKTDISSNESETYYFWGLSEISIVGLQCSTCVSELVTELGNFIGIALGICSSILISMVVIMCIIVQVRIAQKKKKRRSFRRAKREVIKEEEKRQLRNQ